MIESRTWSVACLEGCTARPGRDINTGRRVGALVGCAENCGFSAVAVVGRRPVLGQGRCARWCNDWERAMLGSTMDTCSQFPGGFWTNFYDFPRDWVDSGS